MSLLFSVVVLITGIWLTYWGINKHSKCRIEAIGKEPKSNNFSIDDVPEAPKIYVAYAVGAILSILGLILTLVSIFA